MIRLDNVGVMKGHRRILRGISLTLEPGELLVVAGPNGAGKSTLLQVMAGDLVPDEGEARLEGRALQRWAPLELARRRAVMMQSARLGFSLPVREVVELGLAPFRDTLTRQESAEIVTEALQMADLVQLQAQSYARLSGGEQQRVQFARAVAQIDAGDIASSILLLDEPTASLDLAHAHTALRLARRVAEDGAAVVAVLHDINLASTYADRILVLGNGEVAAFGRPDAAITPALMRSVFQVETEWHGTRFFVLGPA